MIKDFKFVNLPQNHHPILHDYFGYHTSYFQPLEHRILTYSLTAYKCKSKYAEGTIIYKSDFSFIPIRENMFSIIEIYNSEYHFQSLIQILFQNPSNQPLTLVKGLVGCAQQDVSLI